MDGIAAEMLRSGSDVAAELMHKICFRERESGAWTATISVPLYKGNGGRDEWKNYRGITSLSIPGKVYGKNYQ